MRGLELKIVALALVAFFGMDADADLHRERNRVYSEASALVDCGARRGNASRGPAIHRCAPCAMVRLVESCANGWPTSDYLTWDTDLRPQAIIRQPFGADPNALRVIETNSYDGKVLVQYDGQRLWVNADSLDCGTGHEVNRYVRNTSLDNAAACEGSVASGPMMPLVLRQSSAAAGQLIVERALRRAETQIEAFRARVRGDFDKLYLAFICQSGRGELDRTAPMPMARCAEGERSIEEQYAILEKARVRIRALLARAEGVFGPGCVQPPASAPALLRVRGQRQCLTLLRTSEMLESTLSSDSPFDHSLQVAGFHTLFFLLAPQTPDYVDLTGRMALFYGLGLDSEPPERSELRALKDQLLFRRAREIGELDRLQGRASTAWTLHDLHNGYLFGGTGESGIDCSLLVSNAFGLIRDEVGRQVVPRTPELVSIARAVQRPPGSRGAAGGPFGRYARCFQGVDLRAGEVPQRGDIVVERYQPAGHGHVVIVQDYHAASGRITTLEAGGGNMYRPGRGTRDLFEPSCLASSSLTARPVRSGLYVMRYVGGPGCPIR